MGVSSRVFGVDHPAAILRVHDPMPVVARGGGGLQGLLNVTGNEAPVDLVAVVRLPAHPLLADLRDNSIIRGRQPFPFPRTSARSDRDVWKPISRHDVYSGAAVLRDFNLPPFSRAVDLLPANEAISLLGAT